MDCGPCATQLPERAPRILPLPAAMPSGALVVPVKIDGPEATIFSRLTREQARRRKALGQLGADLDAEIFQD